LKNALLPINRLNSCMEKLFIYLLLASSLMSCAQNKTKLADPAIADLYKEVKFRDQGTNYRANVQMGACNFTLLINDVPVVQYFDESSGTFNSTVPINDVILKSGKQTYKLILYPGYKNGKPVAELSENVMADIKIEGFTYIGSSISKIGEPIALINVSSKLQNFKQAGQPTAVYKGEFELKVPYKLTAWSESKDLRKEDQAKLLKEVLAAYKQYEDIITAKDSAGLGRLVYEKEKNYAQALFLDQQGTRKQWATYSTILNAKKLVMEPIENYKMRFYGNGRLVTLERTDFPYKGQPALRADVTDAKGEEYIEYYFYYLHKKPGIDTLELIH